MFHGRLNERIYMFHGQSNKRIYMFHGRLNERIYTNFRFLKIERTYLLFSKKSQMKEYLQLASLVISIFPLSELLLSGGGWMCTFALDQWRIISSQCLVWYLYISWLGSFWFLFTPFFMSSVGLPLGNFYSNSVIMIV